MITKKYLLFIVAVFLLLFVVDLLHLKQETRITELEETVVSLQERLDTVENHLNVVRRATVTAYSPEVRQTDISPTTTAFMTAPKPGTVAVSWDLFRNGWTPGRKVWVENVGVLTINDLMNRRWENRLDVFFHERDDALEFGKRELKVVLIFE